MTAEAAVGTLVEAVELAFPLATIVGIVGAVIAAGLAYSLVWFGIKYAVPRLMGAVKKGRIRA